jgi:hydrogenase maturation protease
MAIPTLIIGIGNDYRGDDAVGLIAARALREKRLPNVEIVEQSGDGVSLMQSWVGAAVVILIDAVYGGREAGTIYRLDASHEPISVESFGASSHLFGVGQAIEMARTLGELPPQLIIYGIEGASYTMGAALSPQVAANLTALVESVIQELAKVANDRLSR